MKFPRNVKLAARLLPAIVIALLVFATLAQAEGYRYKSPNAWSFGVHGDTQWTLSLTDPLNPEGVAVSTIKQINQQMIRNKVAFVLQVGDLTDYAGDAGFVARNAAAQDLYDAGIGFFPLRGNHETYGSLKGRDPNKNLNVPDFKNRFPQTQATAQTFGATNFSWPSSPNDILKGLSYAFDFNDASFVVVDVEQTAVVPQTVPNNPKECVDAVTPGTPVGTTPFCGQGYLYLLSDLGNYNTTFIVYKATYDITNGYTIPYDDYGVAGTKIDPITIAAGTWFRIAGNGRPSTDFKAYDVKNPLQTYKGSPFDIYDPIDLAQNRTLKAPDGPAGTEFWPDKQQSWISNRLDRAKRETNHAFVFSHRAIIAENHLDSFFGGDSTAMPDAQDSFFSAMQNNGVKYMISGHDHLYNRALLASPNGKSGVEQIISIGASSKFYSPAGGFAAGVKERETQISQEVNTMGYYIYTVDGPRVNVDYYSTVFPSSINGFNDAKYPYGAENAASFPLGVTPSLYFVRKESFGYSLNGKEFLVEQGDSYAGIKDSFSGTNAEILAGANGSTSIDLTPITPRVLNKAVNTGWVANPDPIKLKSDVLSLWGMSELGAYGKTDTYVLSMSFDFSRMVHLGNGGIGIATYVNGKWVNAVSQNIDSKAKNFVVGPYKPGYGLGTYGVDPSTKTAWAVLNYNADFAVANDIEVVPGKR